MELALNWKNPEVSPWKTAEGYSWIRIGHQVALSIPISYIARWSSLFLLDSFLDISLCGDENEVLTVCSECSRLGLTMVSLSPVFDTSFASRVMCRNDILAVIGPSAAENVWTLPDGRQLKVCDVADITSASPSLD